MELFLLRQGSYIRSGRKVSSEEDLSTQEIMEPHGQREQARCACSRLTLGGEFRLQGAHVLASGR